MRNNILALCTPNPGNKIIQSLGRKGVNFYEELKIDEKVAVEDPEIIDSKWPVIRFRKTQTISIDDYVYQVISRRKKLKLCELRSRVKVFRDLGVSMQTDLLKDLENDGLIKTWMHPGSPHPKRPYTIPYLVIEVVK